MRIKKYKASAVVSSILAFFLIATVSLKSQAVVPPGVHPDTIESMKMIYKAVVSANPYATPAQIIDELETLVGALEDAGVINANEVVAIESFGYQNMIINGFEGAGTTLEDYGAMLLANPPEKLMLTTIVATAVETYLPSIIASLAATKWFAAGTGVAAGAFIGAAALDELDASQMQQTASKIYTECVADTGCALALLSGDGASVLVWEMGGAIPQYLDGKYTDLGAGGTPAQEMFAYVNSSAVPGYVTYRYSNGTVALVSTDGNTILGTTVKGQTYSAVQITGQPGKYTVTYDSRAIATATAQGVVMGGRVPGQNNGPRNPGTGSVPLRNIPTANGIFTGTLITTDLKASVTSCWNNGGVWDCGDPQAP